MTMSGRWRWVLASVVAVYGCTGVSSMTRRPTGETLAIVEQAGVRKTVSGTGELEALSVLDESGSLGRIERRGGVHWARVTLALSAEEGASRGESVSTLDDRYRLAAGRYELSLRGVAVGAASTDWSAMPELSVAVRLTRDGAGDAVVAEREWRLAGRTTPFANGGSLVWLTSLGEPTLSFEVPSDGVYRVAAQFRLATDAPSASGSLSIDGAFGAVVQAPERRAQEEASAQRLTMQLLALWAPIAGSAGSDHDELQEVAGAIASGFFIEGVDYVETAIDPWQRRVCIEQARLVNEWFGHRAAQDPRWSRWFRMTRIRRQIPLFWQSSNVVTPNVAEPVARWVRDGTGVVMEPKLTATDAMVGRSLTIGVFSVWKGMVEIEGDSSSLLRSSEGAKRSSLVAAASGG